MEPHTPSPWYYRFGLRRVRHSLSVPMSADNVKHAVACVNTRDALYGALLALRAESQNFVDFSEVTRAVALAAIARVEQGAP